jgi:AbrB family looped-hinge helix DNA binding protein
MSLVKVKTKGQVTIPTALRRRAGLSVGDLLEAKMERGKITLTPQSLVDRHIQEGLEDIRNGRTYGPFDSSDEMIKSLQSNIKARSKTRKPKPSR